MGKRVVSALHLDLSQWRWTPHQQNCISHIRLTFCRESSSEMHLRKVDNGKWENEEREREREMRSVVVQWRGV